MGTSNASKGTSGKGTPLIPTWIDQPEGVSGAPTANPDQAGAPETQTPVPQRATTSPSLPPNPADEDPNRFRSSRSAFSSFARSGGGTGMGSPARAVSRYVSRTTGGARQAARGMGSSRATGARLISFLSDVAERGVQEALKSLKLETLAGNPIDDIFIGLTDYICPTGGTVDAGIAREAFVQTISDLAANGITDLGALNIDQIQTVFELFATHSIETRLYNEIGMRAISLPVDALAARAIQQQLSDFVRNGVSDALTQMRSELETVTPNQALQFVENVYERAFTVMVALANSEQE